MNNMNEIEKQIVERKKLDNKMLSDSFIDIADILMNQKTSKTRVEIIDSTTKAILKYFKVKRNNLVTNVNDSVKEKIDACCKKGGLFKRNVILPKGWYKNAVGPFLSIIDDKEIVALLPDKFGVYKYKDPKTFKLVSINHKNQDKFKVAMSFYKKFPSRSINLKDFILYVKDLINVRAFVKALFFNAIAAIIMAFTPLISKNLFSSIVPSKSLNLLLPLFILSVTIIISSNIFSIVKDMYINSISIYSEAMVEAAVMERVLSLPENFFTKYSSGELTSRIGCFPNITSTILSSTITFCMSIFLLILYTYQITFFAPFLLIPAIIIIISTGLIMYFSSMAKNKINKKVYKIRAKIDGMFYAIITGIQKIRLAGAEKRAFARWLKVFSKKIDTEYNSPFLAVHSSVLILAFSIISTIIFEFLAFKTDILVGNYYAFLTDFGLVNTAFTMFIGSIMSFVELKPLIEMVEPILSTCPEYVDDKPIMENCNGNINISHLTFKYNDDNVNIFNDFSLNIKSGEYLAIVGKTGCGKSTLLKLLLGFEKPERGTIYYDNIDMQKIDVKSLRSFIGVVMQNGKLFAGDIYSNIIVAAKDKSIDNAWDAAKLACIDNDIKNMPLGMNTLISEGAVGISGGQKQRVLIARALINKPKIILFDEATSALDNITQKEVFESIATLNSTRIVVAHRLSTVKKCDRIIYLEDGKIVEEGNYDELMNLHGKFESMVKDQMQA